MRERTTRSRSHPPASSINSCRNRHCPKCQTSAREEWLAKRTKDLLPARYFHVVFTLPHELSALVQLQPPLAFSTRTFAPLGHLRRMIDRASEHPPTGNARIEPV